MNPLPSLLLSPFDPSAFDALRRQLDRAGAQDQGPAPACDVAVCADPDAQPFAEMVTMSKRWEQLVEASLYCLPIGTSSDEQTWSHRALVARAAGMDPRAVLCVCEDELDGPTNRLPSTLPYSLCPKHGRARCYPRLTILSRAETMMWREPDSPSPFVLPWVVSP